MQKALARTEVEMLGSGTTMRRTVMVALLAGAVGGACEPFPRDPAGTLTRAAGDTLRVGATEAPPFVVRRGDEAEGVEAAAIRALADSIGATIRWYWGPPEEHFAALERYRLAAAIGGLTAGTPWARRLGLTAPYHTSRITVGVPPGTPVPTSEEALKDRPVAARGGSETLELLESRGAVPVAVERVDTVTGMWVAAPDWEIEAMGWQPAAFALRRHRHVIAGPPGENRFLMALEDVLHGMDVPAHLARSARR